jgi:acetylglutamate kinase
MFTPRGFTYAGIHSGIKAVRSDLALVFSEVPCAAAGCFTRNRSRAAPVVDAAMRLPADGLQAIVINSGNANALAGPDGLRDVVTVCEAAADALQIPSRAVLTASTGIIGVRLPVAKIIQALPRLASSRARGCELAAEAILTTDTRIKLATRSLRSSDKDIRISAFAKGSGMIAPELATVLVFITTDAAIAPEALQSALVRAMGASFHSLTIDGDMSTNDAVIAFANGLAQNPRITEGSAEYADFADAVQSLCVELARAVAEDGEGATKLIEVRVAGAIDVATARDIARAVAGSILVKTALFGADPNWGRILAVAGARAGSQGFCLDPLAATVSLQGMCVFRNGAPVNADLVALRGKLRAPEVTIDLAFVEGHESAVAWGCDLSYDYVKINADYMSLTTSTADGTVRRDDRLTNYTPAFKHALLVEALSYIARFSNKRAVIRYGGDAMRKESLKASFAADINLLRTAGLLPVIVHGAGSELAPSNVTEGTWVETGRLNTELVSLLNARSAHAVGVSGKDAGLLRARKRLGAGAVTGEVTHVNRDYLDVLLDKKYVPIVSPVGLGDDGESLSLDADIAAAEIAVGIGADKLIYLTNVAGILDRGELVSELSASQLAHKLTSGALDETMENTARGALRALEGGVGRVHILDGRSPHSLIAELFTDRGVGTLVRLEA